MFTLRVREGEGWRWSGKDGARYVFAREEAVRQTYTSLKRYALPSLP